jgi:long-chain fatty acid transport protein
MIKPRKLTLIALFLASSPAFCGEFLTSGGSARSTAMGGAYTPEPDNVLDAMASNPAGIALINAPWVDIAVMGGLATGDYTNSVNSAGRLNSVGAIPYGAFGTPLGKHISIGVAALPELLSDARWNYTDPRGGAGSVSYGQVHSVSSITAVRTAFGAGFYLGSRVQIGVTVGTTYNTNELNTAYVFQNYQPLAGLKTLLTLRTAGYGWNGTAGVLVRASHNLRLGASWHSSTSIRSTGQAAGNAGVQFAAIGLGGARPDFRYDAEVDNILPQSVSFETIWQATSKFQVVAQMDWINWGSAFQTLPVILTKGNNADINGLLGTNAFSDSIPVNWHDQVVERLGISRNWREHGVLRAGYAHANTPVPGSTLSPLTAAITRHTISAGAGYSVGRWLFEAAYSIDPLISESNGTSALKSGEFSSTRVSVSTQAVVLTTSLRLR